MQIRPDLAYGRKNGHEGLRRWSNRKRRLRMLETSPELGMPAPMPRGPRPLGELLVAEGLLTQAQLRSALAEQAESGRLLGEIVVQRDLVSMVSLVSALVEQLRERRRLSYSNELRPPIFPTLTEI